MNNYNYLILLFSFILLIHSCKTEKKEEPLAESKTASETYQILGTLKNIADSTWVYINHDNKKIDSTQIIDERFQFKGTLDEPSSFFIIVGKENREYFYLWAENLKITIEGEKGNLKKATIIAGKSQKESALLTKRNDSLQTEFTKVIEKLQSQDVAQMTKEDRGNLIKSQNVLVAEMEKNSQDFIKEFSDSYVSVNLLNGYSRSWNKNVVTQLFNNLSDSMKKSKNGKDIAHFLSLPDTPKIGEKYIDFELPDATEKLVKLSEIKGKYILVEFWASWCVPCIEANPELVKTYNQYKEKGFEIIGVSLDNNKKHWVSAIEKDNLPWVNVSDLKGDKTEVAQIYGINGIPDNLIIDENGIIIAKTLRRNRLEKKLKELFPNTAKN